MMLQGKGNLIVPNEDVIIRSYLCLCDYCDDNNDDDDNDDDKSKNINANHKGNNNTILDHVFKIRQRRKQVVSGIGQSLDRLIHRLRYSSQSKVLAVTTQHECLELESIITTIREQLITLQSTLTEECTLMDQLLFILLTGLTSSNGSSGNKTLWIKTLHTRLYNHIQRWELRITLHILQYMETKLYSTIFMGTEDNYGNQTITGTAIVKQHLDQFQSALLQVNRCTMIDPILLRHVAESIQPLSPTVRSTTNTIVPSQSSITKEFTSSRLQPLQQQQQSIPKLTTTTTDTHYYDDISCAKSLSEAVKIFCSQDRISHRSAILYSALLVAPSGYGKTYTCNQIEKEIDHMKEGNNEIIGRYLLKFIFTYIWFLDTIGIQHILVFMESQLTFCSF
jgi:hypothetical protein